MTNKSASDGSVVVDARSEGTGTRTTPDALSDAEVPASVCAGAVFGVTDVG